MSATLPRIMLIDDSKIDLFLHEKMLKLAGIAQEVKSFLSGESALAYLEEHCNTTEDLPNLILLDIQMPEMNGFDFLSSFESFPNQVKDFCNIIMVSSSLDFVDISRAEANQRVLKLLRKPLDTMQLKDILARLNFTA